MIIRYCDNCKLEYYDLYLSECPKCNKKMSLTSKIYYCEKCNIPIYTDKCEICGSYGKYLATDVRPVFPKERLLIEIILKKPLEFRYSSVWADITGNRYFIDGKELRINKKQIYKNISEADIKEVHRKLREIEDKEGEKKFNEIIKKFIEANAFHFEKLFFDAKNFIKENTKGYSLDEIFISFSGGKDSTVVSDLVMKALSTSKIIHIHGDTTLEFPFTTEYVNRFRKNNPYTPLIIASNKDANFFELCDILGPPSRVMRWCCTVFKTGPITKKINILFKNKEKVLTFYGIRSSESNSRSKYSEVTISPKITKQVVISPIFNWTNFDVWLYILTTGIDFNEAYKLGYTRVGCWCCPNNSEWSEFLSRIYMMEMTEKWETLLVDFAKRLGKEDAEVYVKEGKWKARQGGEGLEYSTNSIISYKPCSSDENTLYYELKKPISKQLYEYFKPFGELNFEIGNKLLGEVYVLDRNKNVVLKLQGIEGDTNLKVSVYGNKTKIIKQKIDAQITKYQMCIGCLACEGICPLGAIKIIGNEYKIDDSKCIRCGKCIHYFGGGCYIRKVLTIKRGV